MRHLSIVFIILFTTVGAPLQAQVGINTDTPSQSLDVEGKIEVGDDEESPTEGTIRYNSTSKDFEGFDGTNWYSLTGKEESTTVTYPVPGETNPFPAPPTPAFYVINDDNTITFQVEFSDAVDQSTVVVGDSFILRGDATPSSSFVPGTLTWLNTTTVEFTSSVSIDDFMACTSTLTIKGDSKDHIKDSKGFTLDGDGNDVPGGDFVFVLSILC